MNGEDDRISRSEAIERNAEIADGTAVAIRDAGHTINLERPGAYTSAVREFVFNYCGGDSPSGEIGL